MADTKPTGKIEYERPEIVERMSVDASLRPVPSNGLPLP